MFNFSKKPRKLSTDQLCSFTEGLSILSAANLPQDYALETLVGILESEKLRKIAEDILQRVRQGQSLSAAMKQTKGAFPRSYVGMIQAGEFSGSLSYVLDQLNTGLQRSRDLRRHITSALVYPTLLISISTLAVFFILTYVLPSFVEIFKDMNQPMPPSAEVLIAIGDFMTSYGWTLPLGLVLVIVSSVLALRKPLIRLGVDKFLLNSGPLGRAITSWQTARYCRTLGLMVKGGVPLADACRFAAESCGNSYFRKAVMQVEGALTEGRGLGTGLKESGVMPLMARRMVALGEESGSLGEMLFHTAGHLETKVKTDLNRLIVMIEPGIIVLMGLVVGSIVVTMITTILTLTQGGY